MASYPLKNGLLHRMLWLRILLGLAELSVDRPTRIAGCSNIFGRDFARLVEYDNRIYDAKSKHQLVAVSKPGLLRIEQDHIRKVKLTLQH